MIDTAKIKPRSNMILLEPDEHRKSRGLIHFPEGSMDDVFAMAMVRAVGPGRFNDKGKLEPIEVKVGDRVALLRFHLDAQEVGSTGLALVAEPDIWGVVEN